MSGSGVGSLLLYLSLMVPLTSVSGEAPWELVVFDVGQGDATLLRQPGACTLLIDAGPLESAAALVARLEALQVRRLDHLLITHPHLDHFGGVFALPSQLAINRVYDPGRDNPDVVTYTPYREWRARHPYQPLARGDSLACGAARLEVLWPPRGESGRWSINDSSLVLRVRLGEVTLLLAGDIGPRAKTALLELEPQLRATLLKVAHHGGDDPEVVPAWRRLQPEWALISVAAENRFGAPNPATLRAWRKVGTRIWRTDQQGELRVVIDHAGYRILQ